MCRLANLPDLDQSNQFVRSTLKQWIHDTVSTYGFDGIRVDTVPEVPKDFWSEYTQSAGVYSVGEVFNGDPNYVSGYQGPLSGLLNYPMYYHLGRAYQQRQSARDIHDGVTQNQKAFQDVSILGNFLDNHDNPRFLHGTGDTALLKNALAYIIYAEVSNVEDPCPELAEDLCDVSCDSDRIPTNRFFYAIRTFRKLPPISL